MSRGREPVMAKSEALAIARKRGEVRQFMHEPGRICDFVIYSPAITAHVRIRRVTRVHCSHAWIEREAADALAALRAIAAGTGISRELWAFLPRGAFRFFRVEATGLCELDRAGMVIVPKTWADVRAEQIAAEAGPEVQVQAADPAHPTEGIGTASAATPQVQAPPPEPSSKFEDLSEARIENEKISSEIFEES
jgi:hypothetical protein